MFFPIRCVFWLTIVYTTIYSQDQPRRIAPIMELSQSLHSFIGRTFGRIESRLAEHCEHHAVECLSAAAKLSQAVRDPQPSETGTVAPQPPRRDPQRRGERGMPALPGVDDLRLHTDGPHG
jgi:hypothetical protein